MRRGSFLDLEAKRGATFRRRWTAQTATSFRDLLGRFLFSAASQPGKITMWGALKKSSFIIMVRKTLNTDHSVS